MRGLLGSVERVMGIEPTTFSLGKPSAVRRRPKSLNLGDCGQRGTARDDEMNSSVNSRSGSSREESFGNCPAGGRKRSKEFDFSVGALVLVSVSPVLESVRVLRQHRLELRFPFSEPCNDRLLALGGSLLEQRHEIVSSCVFPFFENENRFEV